MTKKEVAKLLGYDEDYIHVFFRKAKKDMPSIAIKAHKSTVSKVVDYTLEECLCAMKYLPDFTPLQKILLEENFINRNGLYEDRTIKNVKLSSDAKNFLFLCKRKSAMPKVCATCAFLTKRKMNKVFYGYSPYCNLYSSFLNKAKPKRNIYKDRCESYQKADSPLVFAKNNSQNIDSKGNFISDKILGIDVNAFTSGNRKNEEVILLSKVEVVK